MSVCAVVVAVVASACLAEAPGRAPLKLKLPKPQFVGTPKNVKTANLEAPRKIGKRPPLLVPAGVTNVARGKTVTSSDSEPLIGELSLITDGNKEAEEGSFVELAPGKQWVQIDLGKRHGIYAIVVWHFHRQARVYRDVVVRVSDDAKFATGVRTVYNNDHDNSSGLGKGADKEYFETYEGRLIDAKGVRGRYVRLYSRGSTEGEMNHCIEVEVHGRVEKADGANGAKGAAATGTPAGKLKRLFAMNISRAAFRAPVAKRIAWAKGAGYAAQHHMGTANMAKVIAAHDAAKLRLAAVYVTVNVAKGKLPGDLAAAVEAMKHHKTFIWLGLTGGKASTTSLDDKAVAVVQQAADIAAKGGLKIALYPHTNFYAEKVDDCLRIATKAGRTNVGVTFNLCHFLKTEPGKDWTKTLDRAKAKLFVVSISGADPKGTNWGALIQPLDKGTFDMAAFLAYLDKIKFAGPIGVQDYGIGGDPGATLKRSYDAYKKLIGRR